LILPAPERLDFTSCFMVLERTFSLQRIAHYGGNGTAGGAQQGKRPTHFFSHLLVCPVLALILCLSVVPRSLDSSIRREHDIMEYPTTQEIVELWSF
jgi:hypothetical protein